MVALLMSRSFMRSPGAAQCADFIDVAALTGPLWEKFTGGVRRLPCHHALQENALTDALRIGARDCPFQPLGLAAVVAFGAAFRQLHCCLDAGGAGRRL